MHNTMYSSQPDFLCVIQNNIKQELSTTIIQLENSLNETVAVICLLQKLKSFNQHSAIYIITIFFLQQYNMFNRHMTKVPYGATIQKILQGSQHVTPLTIPRL